MRSKIFWFCCYFLGYILIGAGCSIFLGELFVSNASKIDWNFCCSGLDSIFVWDFFTYGFLTGLDSSLMMSEASSAMIKSSGFLFLWRSLNLL